MPVRKKGKLPYKTIEETYNLEYGRETLSMHVDAVKAGDRVVIVDDVLATGGTAGMLQKTLRQPIKLVPDLTLRGLAAAWRLNAPPA